MDNFNNEFYGLQDNDKEELESSKESFNYNSISGLGESNYENEDLFTDENSTPDTLENNSSYSEDDNSITLDGEDTVDDSNTQYVNEEFVGDDESNFKDIGFNEDMNDSSFDNSELSKDDNLDENIDLEQTNENDATFEPEVDESDLNSNDLPDSYEMNDDESNEKENDIQGDYQDNTSSSEIDDKIEMSDVPIEEIQKLTEYEDDKVEETNINELFDKVSTNVKDASEIFRKNTDLKQKIDSRFEELKALQSEVESSKKSQLDEVNKYKEEVLSKLTEKKDEIEKRLNVLKDLQASLEKEKEEFEQYKKSENDKIEQIQKNVQAAYDERREELSHIEDILRKQKDALDEERNQLSLDKIQYEADKNELANNLLKFNELVGSFTNGVKDIKE